MKAAEKAEAMEAFKKVTGMIQVVPCKNQPNLRLVNELFPLSTQFGAIYRSLGIEIPDTSVFGSLLCLQRTELVFVPSSITDPQVRRGLEALL